LQDGLPSIIMIHATNGIVLNHVRYGETSAVVHIYTEHFGQQSYMVNGVRSTRNKGKSVLLQPLTLLSMQVYHKQGKEIQRIKEFEVALPFVSIPFDQTKRSIAFFITEMMRRSLREEEANPSLFGFIEQSVRDLDAMPRSGNYHLTFLAGLTRYLGFYPDLSHYAPDHWFDLENGVFSGHLTPSPQSVPSDLCGLWVNVFEPDSNPSVPVNSEQRNRLAEYMIDFYALHLPGFGRVKSLDILQGIYL